MKSTSLYRCIAVQLLAFFVLSCSGGKPYRLIAQAAKSPERAAVFAHDKRLRLSVRRALVLARPDATLSVSPYVTGGRAYLVGWVTDNEERQTLEQAARSVPGLLSVDTYLPVRPTGGATLDSTGELELKAKVVGAIVATSGTDKINIAVDVLGTHAVLTGAVRSLDDLQRAVRAASATTGVSDITSFLSVPSARDAKRFGGFLL